MPRTNQNPKAGSTPTQATSDVPQGSVASVAVHCEPSDQWLASLVGAIMDEAFGQLDRAEREQKDGDKYGCATSLAASRALRYMARAVEEMRKD